MFKQTSAMGYFEQLCLGFSLLAFQQTAPALRWARAILKFGWKILNNTDFHLQLCETPLENVNFTKAITRIHTIQQIHYLRPGLNQVVFPLVTKLRTIIHAHVIGSKFKNLHAILDSHPGLPAFQVFEPSDERW